MKLYRLSDAAIEEAKHLHEISSGASARTGALEEVFMIRILLEGVAIVSAIGLLSLLAGLLMSAKSSSQVTEEQHDSSLPDVDRQPDARPKRKNQAPLRTAS
jgi:hypothetical protein